MVMEVDYEIIRNIHKDKAAVIVGGSKEIVNFPFSSFGGVIFSINDIPLRSHGLFRTDYWVFSNPHWARPWRVLDAEALNLVNARKIFMSTASFAYQEPGTVEEKIRKSILAVESPIFCFDERHISGKSCINKESACCDAKDFLGIRATLQEEVQREFGSTSLYGPSATVVIHALALAMVMGCRPIYISGVDIPLLAKDHTYFSTKNGEALIQKYRTKGSLEDEHYKITLRRIIKEKSPRLFLAWFGKLKSFVNQRSEFNPDLVGILSDFDYLGRLFMRVNGKPSIYNTNPRSSLINVGSIKTISYDQVNVN